MSANINLLQNQLTQDKSRRTKRILSTIQGITILIAVTALVAAGALFGWNYLASRAKEKMQANIQEQEQKLTQQISEKREIVVNMQTQVSSLRDLLPKHIYWTNVLKILNESALEGIQYTGITGGLENSQVFIDGFADDLTYLAAFTQRLNKNEEITSVELNSVTLSGVQDRVLYRFTIRTTFAADVLNYSAE